jgi:hypothetical protein
MHWQWPFFKSALEGVGYRFKIFLVAGPDVPAKV